MTKILLSLLLLTIFVPLYVAGNLVLVAWIRRHTPDWLRGAKLFVLRQVRPLTALRFRITALGQLVAMIVLAVGIRHRLEIIELSLLLIGYVVVASALTLSLLAQMPVFKRMASDAFMRPILLVAPVVLAYLCRGYSAMWVDETLGISAENAPLAHFAGTLMMAGFATAVLVMIVAVAFEFAMIVTPSLPTSNTKRHRLKTNEPKPSLRAWCLSLFSAKLDVSTPEHREWRRAARTMRLIVTFALSFMGCMLVSQAALARKSGSLNDRVRLRCGACEPLRTSDQAREGRRGRRSSQTQSTAALDISGEGHPCAAQCSLVRPDPAPRSERREGTHANHRTPRSVLRACVKRSKVN